MSPQPDPAQSACRLWAIEFSNGWQYTPSDQAAADARSSGLTVVEYVTAERAGECEEALEDMRAELFRAEQVLVAADRVREAYEAMIEGRDIGCLPDWEPTRG